MSDRDDRHPDELVSALFDGELAPEEWTEVKEHLAHCPRCQRLLESIKALSGSMPDAPSVPDDLAAKVKSRLPAGTGRQRVTAPREPIPYKPRKLRIGFPLAAGAGLAAALILGVMLYEYLPGGLWRMAPARSEPAAEPAADERPKDGTGRHQAAAETEAKAEAPSAQAAKANAANEIPAEAAGVAADEAATQVSPDDKGFAPVPPAGAVAVRGAEREGLAPGQELPVVVPEDLDQPARTAEQIEAVDRTLEADRGAPGAEAPGSGVVGGVERQKRLEAASTPEATPAAPQMSRTAADSATRVPAAASVDACRASWNATRQAFWPEGAGGEPARKIGGAAAAAGGRAILFDGPPRVRITIPRDRWGALLERLAAAGVSGTAQLPPPPDSADCAVLIVALPPAEPAAPANP